MATPTPGGHHHHHSGTPTPGQVGLSKAERELLMIDEEGDDLLYQRDSERLNEYLLHEQHNYIYKKQDHNQQRENKEAKRKLMKKINRVDDRQQLGDIEGEDQQMRELIKRETQRPITFTQDNQLDPENPSWSAGSEEESFDFHRQDDERRKALTQ